MPKMENEESCRKERNYPIPKTRSISYHIKTLYLFTKSDFKTVVVPQSIFAISIALSLAQDQVTTITTQHQTQVMANILVKLPRMLTWVWLHLLIEDISNQRLDGSVLEDKENKPWRPLPAGRTTPDEAQCLLRVLVPLTVGFSFFYGGYLPSVTLMSLIWLYNDLEGANAGPCQRNLINAGGLACFGWGAMNMLVEGWYLTGDYGTQILRWIALTATIVATTVFAQDFPDMIGDKARGRKTVPLLYSEAPSRVALALTIMFWSAVCPFFWDVVLGAWLGLLCIGGTMAVLTVCCRNQSCDATVWRLWCVWITVIYILPVFRQ